MTWFYHASVFAPIRSRVIFQIRQHVRDILITGSLILTGSLVNSLADPGIVYIALSDILIQMGLHYLRIITDERQ